MDAWETLTSNSTIETGDAWDHLLAQGGGGGIGTIVHVGAELSSDVIGYCSTGVDAVTLSADVVAVTSASLQNNTIFTVNNLTTTETTICQLQL